MKKSILVSLFIISFLVLKCNVYGQFSLSYKLSTDDNRIGFGYNFTKTIWADLNLKEHTHTDSYNLGNISGPRLAIQFNIIKRERHNIYMGLGIRNNSHYGLFNTIPVGLQFTPIENFKRFSIQIEFETGFVNGVQANNIYFKNSFGIRYMFKDCNN